MICLHILESKIVYNYIIFAPGIGFAIVRALCKQFDGEVYLTSRDEGRGIEAVELLKKVIRYNIFIQYWIL